RRDEELEIALAAEGRRRVGQPGNAIEDLPEQQQPDHRLDQREVDGDRSPQQFRERPPKQDERLGEEGAGAVWDHVSIASGDRLCTHCPPLVLNRAWRAGGVSPPRAPRLQAGPSRGGPAPRPPGSASPAGAPPAPPAPRPPVRAPRL